MENKMASIMEDIQTALTQAHHVSKRHHIRTKSETRPMNINQEGIGSQILFTPCSTDQQPLITRTIEVSPTESPLSFSLSFNRGTSMKQKLTSLVLSPTQFLRHGTSSSKPNALLPPSYIRADAASKVHPAHRNSMPECFMIGTIPEDSTDGRTIQHDPGDKVEEKRLCSKNTIIRRSSLTGQLEQHYKLPPQDYDIKTARDSNEQVRKKKTSTGASRSTHNIITISHKSPKKYSEKRYSKMKHGVILPSIETTV